MVRVLREIPVTSQDLETVALESCGVDPAHGTEILFGPAYSGNKTVLLKGIKDITHAAEAALKDHEDHKEEHTNMARDLAKGVNLRHDMP